MHFKGWASFFFVLVIFASIKRTYLYPDSPKTSGLCKHYILTQTWMLTFDYPKTQLSL